ncbi:MAG: DUF998 domain-containing protein, partial [Pseudomonadota bacterium]
VGLLGITMPFVLWLGGAWVFDLKLQESMSSYYYTSMRDVFVGFLFAIGTFFITYRGHSRWDTVAGFMVCVFALGVALFPTVNCATQLADACQNSNYQTPFHAKVHFSSAAGLLITLAIFSLFLFTKSDPDQPMTPRKKVRNIIYRTCGGVIIAAVVVAAIYVARYPTCCSETDATVFFLEATALLAFGFSWIVKGEAILGDVEQAG